MKKNIGLWIDRREALIVTITDEGETTTRIYSEIEKTFQSPRNPRSAGSQDVVKKQDRQYLNSLRKYYDAVTRIIRSADSIWIFGPGEAKHELARRLRSNKLGDLVSGIETTDNLTTPQILSKVRKYFEE